MLIFINIYLYFVQIRIVLHDMSIFLLDRSAIQDRDNRQGSRCRKRRAGSETWGDQPFHCCCPVTWLL